MIGTIQEIGNQVGDMLPVELLLNGGIANNIFTQEDAETEIVVGTTTISYLKKNAEKAKAKEKEKARKEKVRVSTAKAKTKEKVNTVKERKDKTKVRGRKVRKMENLAKEKAGKAGKAKEKMIGRKEAGKEEKMDGIHPLQHLIRNQDNLIFKPYWQNSQKEVHHHQE